MFSKKLKYEFIDPEEQLSSTAFKVVENFLNDTGRTQIGWHYIADLIWIFRRIKRWPRGSKILDAGGGNGPLQFLLAEMGFNIVNIDLLLSKPQVGYRIRYGCKFQRLTSYTSTTYSRFLSPLKDKPLKTYLIQKALRYLRNILKLPPLSYFRSCRQWRNRYNFRSRIGNIQWLSGNLCFMPELGSSTFDGVVSLSALEHIPSDSLPQALKEIRRVLKPEARWLVTTSGTDQPTSWFHEPSQGWCFSVSDIQSKFDASTSKIIEPTDILKKYQSCEYLQENLADFYKTSKRYGMPLGKWNPKYIPIGIYGLKR